MLPKKVKIKRVRDGKNIQLDTSVALALLIENSKFKKSEFELNEKNYLFGNNEIYIKPKNQPTQSTEIQGGAL